MIFDALGGGGKLAQHGWRRVPAQRKLDISCYKHIPENDNHDKLMTILTLAIEVSNQTTHCSNTGSIHNTQYWQSPLSFQGIW